MKATKMKQKGQYVGALDMQRLLSDLRIEFAKAGFVTEVYQTSATSIHIGLRGKSFTINPNVHNRNLRINPHSKPKLTTTPTWEQRVEFNNIVNKFFNKYKISANIKSGPFTIRNGLESLTESDWEDQKPEYLWHNEARGFKIEAIDEANFIKERRLERNAQARAKRAEKKVLNDNA